MSQPTIGIADRLVHLLPPATAVGSTATVLAHYDLVNARLAGQLALIDAIRQRFPRLPDPPAQQSLQELVQAGRRALREEQSSAALSEVQARQVLVDRLRAGLQP